MTDVAGADLQELVDAVAATTGAPVTLEDRDLHLVASSGHDDEAVDEVRRRSILRRRSSAQVQALFASFGIAAAPGPLRVPGDAAAGRFARWCLPVRWHGVVHGYLWLLDPDGAVTAAGLAAAGGAVDAVAVVLATRARAADRTTWAVGDLLSDDPGRRARAADDLTRYGALPGGDLRVVALAPADGSPTGPVNAWVLPRAVLSAPVGARAALLVPAGLDAGPVAERAAEALLAQHPGGVRAGTSGAVPTAGADRGWRQADAALRAGGGPGVVVRDWDRLGAHRLRALADPAALEEAVLDPRARALLAADPDLVRTARTYLDLAGSAQRTAAALSVHRQTLHHRLRRIAAVSGYDLADGADRLALHLALTLGPPATPPPPAARSRVTGGG